MTHRIAIFILLLLCIVNGTAFAGLDEGRAAFERGDYATVLTEVRPLADQGNAVAQAMIGEMYLNGYGTAPDVQLALEWFRKAAAQGLAGAQNILGNIFRDGHGVPQDEKQAVEWYRKAAAQGEPNAQVSIGKMYQDGAGGLPRDDKQAVEWYRKAAEQGYAIGQDNLGDMYLDGRGVPQDDKQAVEWYRKAAEQGFAPAQDNLASMYFNGRGLPQDSERALAWFLKAAAQGLADAQVKLGFMYESGRGGALRDSPRPPRPSRLRRVPVAVGQALRTGGRAGPLAAAVAAVLSPPNDGGAHPRAGGSLRVLRRGARRIAVRSNEGGRRRGRARDRRPVAGERRVHALRRALGLPHPGLPAVSSED